MTTGKKKGRRKRLAGGQELLGAALAGILIVCAVSVALGVMNRMARAPVDEVAETMRLEVLNGTGHAGLGKIVARELMKRKVDVLLVGNADGFDYTQTVLIARKRKPQVESLAEELGCKRFVEQLKDDAVVDATLIIGADYRKLTLGLENESSLSE